jgi:hypothetical protein
MSDITDAEVAEVQRLASTKYLVDLPSEVARALIDMDRAMAAPLGMSLRFLAQEQALCCLTIYACRRSLAEGGSDE